MQVAHDSLASARLPLAQLLDRASRQNELPADLVAFKARVESEIAMLSRRDDGTELLFSLEQVASSLRWTRAGHYDQRVQGYRGQQENLMLSALSGVSTGWVQPTLYGSRFQLRRRVVADTNPDGTPDSTRASLAIHPLAVDRDRWYRYSGGDTVVVMRLANREVPIVQVRVRPRHDLERPALLFDGEISLDATRGMLVRMRGHFLRTGGVPFLDNSVLTAAVFVDYEQGEYNGEYWLPYRQRIELQAAVPLFGEGRVAVRVASRVLEMVINDTILDASTLATADSLRELSRRQLTYAPADSVGQFAEWRLPSGVITQDMHSDDFNDIGPDRWRPTGPPRFDVAAQRAGDVLHFNRIEGYYTGLGTRLSLRDVAPGVVLRVNAGYAWQEETFRGRVAFERTRGNWRQAIRAGSWLDITNDFRAPGDSGTGMLSVLYTNDPYDYVDRRGGTLSLVRHTNARRFVVRAEAGMIEDRYRPALREVGPFGRPALRENRHVDDGRYWRSMTTLEYRPDVLAAFVKPGLGVRLSYERGDGELDWQRAEVRAVSRHSVGPLIATSRIDAGALLGGDVPTQQLFELGGLQNLSGYAYKAFVGSRAASLRARVLYIGPFLRQPLRVPVFNFYYPALAPGLNIGAAAGWTEAHNQRTLDAIDRLCAPSESISLCTTPARPTGRIRATASVGFTLFAGGLFLGFSRPLDIASPWVFGFGNGY